MTAFTVIDGGLVGHWVSRLELWSGFCLQWRSQIAMSPKGKRHRAT